PRGGHAQDEAGRPGAGPRGVAGLRAGAPRPARPARGPAAHLLTGRSLAPMDLANLDPSQVLRQTILGMSRNDQLRSVIEKAPVSGDIVRRFVGGVSSEDAVRTATELVDTRRLVTIDYLGEDTLDPTQAAATR